MRSGDITGVTGVLELTWCYNHNSTPLLDRALLDLGFERSWQGHVTWAYKCTSEQKTLIDPFTMTTTTALEQQIVALLGQLEENKEAERLEAAREEAEAMAEKACEEEEWRRL